MALYQIESVAYDSFQIRLHGSDYESLRVPSFIRVAICALRNFIARLPAAYQRIHCIAYRAFPALVEQLMIVALAIHVCAAPSRRIVVLLVVVIARKRDNAFAVF